ncbi:MAG: lamin tail domain-containing protein [Myxococcota bacterium]
MHHSIRVAALFAASLMATACAGDDPEKETAETGAGDTGPAPVVDADNDGVPTADDCDDNDEMLGAIADDADCDGILTADDCDDNDDQSNAVADDGDCDGFLTADDCDDADPAINPDAAEIPGNGTDDNCDEADTATILLNEMQYDPVGGVPAAPGDGGDANFDGVRGAMDDEFVELVNTETFSVDVSGFMLFDQENLDAVATKGPNHTVPDGTVLAPGQALVVFGGGMPGIDTREFLDEKGKKPNPNFNMVTNDFGGSIVQTSTFGELNLNNGGDIFYLQDSAGNELIARDIETFPNYTSAADQAFTRNPDLTGDFDLHTNVVKGVLFTPGTRIDGTDF